MYVVNATLTFGWVTPAGYFIKRTELAGLSCDSMCVYVQLNAGSSAAGKSVYEFAKKVLLSHAVRSAQTLPAKIRWCPIRLLFRQQRGV